MGDPKTQKKKYMTPGHPWQKERIERESKLMKEYGIKNKKELWKMDTSRKKLSVQVKAMIADQTPQAEIEKKQMVEKLFKLGYLGTENSDFDDVLSIGIKDILERRLQTLVFKKKIANSISQARQFIVHCHITVAGKKVTSPSHITTRGEEATIQFSLDSPFNAADHPEVNKEKELVKGVENGKTN